MQIGIFGGTFDPIHNGHLIIAQTAVNELALNKVLFVPAGAPPHKLDNKILEAELRCHLVELAIESNTCFALSRIEVDRQGPSFMVDTIEQLAGQPEFSMAEFFLILGADNLLQFESWRDPERILRYCKLAVYPRYEADLAQLDPDFMEKVVLFSTPRMEISSSYIRELVRLGKSVRYLVPDGVERFIQQQGLYRDGAQA